MNSLRKSVGYSNSSEIKKSQGGQNPIQHSKSPQAKAKNLSSETPPKLKNLSTDYYVEVIMPNFENLQEVPLPTQLPSVSKPLSTKSSTVLASISSTQEDEDKVEKCYALLVELINYVQIEKRSSESSKKINNTIFNQFDLIKDEGNISNVSKSLQDTFAIYGDYTDKYYYDACLIMGALALKQKEFEKAKAYFTENLIYNNQTLDYKKRKNNIVELIVVFYGGVSKVPKGFLTDYLKELDPDYLKHYQNKDIDPFSIDDFLDDLSDDSSDSMESSDGEFDFTSGSEKLVKDFDDFSFGK